MQTKNGKKVLTASLVITFGTFNIPDYIYSVVLNVRVLDTSVLIVQNMS